MSGAAAAKPKSLEAHRFEGHVACENQQVGPGEFAAVLLLDGPKQSARLVEVHIVGPAIQRSEALRTAACAAASIMDAVGAGGMPGHANEERSVVAEVGRPPLLRIRHEIAQVLDHGVEIESLEFLAIVELRAHGIA